MEYQPLNQQTKFDTYQQPQQYVATQQPPQQFVAEQAYAYNYQPPQQPQQPQTTIYQQSHVVTQQPGIDFGETQKHEQNSMILFILGFFIGIVWLVNFVMHRNSPSPIARKWAKASMIAFVTCLVLSVVFFILYLIIFFSVLG